MNGFWSLLFHFLPMIQLHIKETVRTASRGGLYTSTPIDSGVAHMSKAIWADMKWWNVKQRLWKASGISTGSSCLPATHHEKSTPPMTAMPFTSVSEWEIHGTTPNPSLADLSQPTDYRVHGQEICVLQWNLTNRYTNPFLLSFM